MYMYMYIYTIYAFTYIIPVATPILPSLEQSTAAWSGSSSLESCCTSALLMGTSPRSASEVRSSCRVKG